MRASVKMLGVTGGIGSGKTTICKIFESLGVPVYYADERAKWLTQHDPQIRREIVSLLGAEAYSSNGIYNTSFVSSKVFRDQSLLSALNRIVHPKVKEDTRLWVQTYRELPYVVKEAAIMSKAGAENGLDFVLAVISPEQLRINRVLGRDPHRSEGEVRAIISKQAPESYLREIADFVVQNNEEELIIPQVLRIHQYLSK